LTRQACLSPPQPADLIALAQLQREFHFTTQMEFTMERLSGPAQRLNGPLRPDSILRGKEHIVTEHHHQDEYWGKTSRLMWIMLALWVFFGFIIHYFVKSLNDINFLGFPLGFYMAAQGSLIAFVIILFLFAQRQDSIDRKSGMAEEE
jgi:putative solute:sodium symporter small subunit